MNTLPDTLTLPEPADYFPLEDGRYQVRPGLFPLGRDFGNGEADRRVFQIDRQFSWYRRQKNASLAEAGEKYQCQDQLDETLQQSLAGFLLDTLCREYPWLFSWRQLESIGCLQCRHSGDTLYLDQDLHLQQLAAGPLGAPPCHDTLQALALQLQEDLALITVSPNGDRIRWLHLCYPNRWAAGDKIGGSFIDAHRPVPGIEGINTRAQPLLQAMVNKGPFVRFAWGISATAQLNLHPDGGATTEPAIDKAPWYLRTERQTISGLPKVGASLFTIRTCLRPLRDLTAVRARLLAQALETMPEDSAVYKGLVTSREAIIRGLRAQAENG